MKNIKYNPNLISCAGLAAALLLAGCDQKSSSSTSSTSAPADATPNTTTAAAVDNSSNNVRDRNSLSLTPGDQGNSDADRTVTQKIRQILVRGTNSITGTNDFSLTAKNVKIITAGGKVTLRGPVNTADEKTGIEAIAKNVAGDGNVDDQLEVKNNP
jgi:hyperosmotically inducible protein